MSSGVVVTTVGSAVATSVATESGVVDGNVAIVSGGLGEGDMANDGCAVRVSNGALGRTAEQAVKRRRAPR